MKLTFPMYETGETALTKALSLSLSNEIDNEILNDIMRFAEMDPTVILMKQMIRNELGIIPYEDMKTCEAFKDMNKEDARKMKRKFRKLKRIILKKEKHKHVKNKSFVVYEIERLISEEAFSRLNGGTVKSNVIK